MNRYDFNGIKVGCTVFVVKPKGNPRQYEWAKPMQVTKVGRKYFYCDDMKFDKDNGLDSDTRAEAWANAEQFRQYGETEERYALIKDAEAVLRKISLNDLAGFVEQFTR